VKPNYPPPFTNAFRTAMRLAASPTVCRHKTPHKHKNKPSKTLEKR
jgi:hypothetical protein